MFKILTIVALFTIAIFSSGCLESIHANEGHTDALIEKKFIDLSKEGSHYLLVTEQGMFEVNRPILDTFNESRNPDVVYSKIIEGKKYRLHHYGFRIDWLYEYPIVIEATQIE